MRQPGDLSAESIAEAAAIAGYASGQEVASSLDAIESELDDDYLTAAVLAVADHVCDLRHRRGSVAGYSAGPS
jgi:hypothetical protein